MGDGSGISESSDVCYQTTDPMSHTLVSRKCYAFNWRPSSTNPMVDPEIYDRYANIEIGYLLQMIEEYRALAILATNLGKDVDEIASHGIRFIVEFPLSQGE